MKVRTRVDVNGRVTEVERSCLWVLLVFFVIPWAVVIGAVWLVVIGVRAVWP